MKPKYTKFDAVVRILFIYSLIQTSVQWLMQISLKECIENMKNDKDMINLLHYLIYKYKILILF